MARMSTEELVNKLRGWGRRYGPRSQERMLMWEAADRLEEGEDGPEITVEAVEEALGGKSLLPWQKKALSGD